MTRFPRIVVQYVGRDGCYVMNGVRVRCAPGNGAGSLRDEFASGIRTPFASEKDRHDLSGSVSGPKLKEFVRSLPAARLETLESD